MAVNSIDADSNSRDTDDESIDGEDLDGYLNNFRVSELISNNRQLNPNYQSNVHRQNKNNSDGRVLSLAELAAKEVACHIPFGLVEHFEPPVPDQTQCRIAFWSFPQDEEDIKFYTCLANGNADVFCRAEELISANCVCDMLQVGFHLSANVKQMTSNTDDGYLRVAMTFDRRKITSCSCSCTATTFWCEHTVAVCLQRIRKPQDISIRAPVSESLQRLEKNQLQKFAQYLINELPQQILPAAQKLLDELLSGNNAGINQNPAAPDPTAGATVHEQTRWCLDDTHLRCRINRILNKQSSSQATIICDVQTLNTSPPPSVSEFSELLRAIRGREPEGIWNLITIVSEMMKRHDSNFRVLLEILTEEILCCDRIVTWWFETKVSLHAASTLYISSKQNNNNNNNSNNANPQSTAQYSSSNFCDEIVHLWRLAAMHPNRDPIEVEQLYKKFYDWHLKILKKHYQLANDIHLNRGKQNIRNVIDLFPGFRPCLEGCLIKWEDWDGKKNCLVYPEAAFEKENQIKSSKRKRKALAKRRRVLARQAALMTQNEKPQEVNLEKNSIPTSSSFDDINPEPCSSNQPPNQSNLNSDLTEKISNLVIDEPEEMNMVADEESFKDPNIDMADNSQSNNEHDYAIEPDGTDDEGSVEPQRSRRDSASSSPRRSLYNRDRIAGLARIDRDLQVYMLEPNNIENDASSSVGEPENLEDLIKVNVIKLNDQLEIMYAKCESLYAHGFVSEARILAAKVSHQILSFPKYPNLKTLCNLPRRRKRGTMKNLPNRMSLVTSEALAKIIFLCNVMLDYPELDDLVFRLGLFGIEMRTNPSATRFLEVKLISQKQELTTILKNIKLGESELLVLRDRAQSMIDGQFMEHSDAATTLTLANFIMEALILSKCIPPIDANDNQQQPQHQQPRQDDSNQPNVQQLVNHLNNNNNNNLVMINQNHHNNNNNNINQDQFNAENRHEVQHQADFEALIIDHRPTKMILINEKQLSDIQLGFNAALEALRTKVNFVETDHPLIAQGIRRQRADLALALMTEFKDDDKKLDLILTNFLSSDGLINNVDDNNSTATMPNCLNNQSPSENLLPTATSKSQSTSKKISSSMMEPTKALSHVIFELAQTVYDRAGGNSMTTYVFRPIADRNIHHALHLCSLRLALHALKLTNRLHPTWIHRTYNRLSSFIHEQALDIGLPAIKLLSQMWDGCLTPLETALLADKAGRSDNPETKAVAAELAKSCLRYSNILASNAVQRILTQCKEQNIDMLEEACREVEKVAKIAPVDPNVLFIVSRAWHGLYMNLIRVEGQCESGRCPFMMNDYHHHQQVMIPDWQVTSMGQNHNVCKHLYDPPHWNIAGYYYLDHYLPTQKHVDYVEAAYRVGMRALAQRSSNQTNNKNFPFREDDIILLLGLSKLLGRNQLLEFSIAVCANVTNPYSLYTIVHDLFKFFQHLPYDDLDRIEMLLPMVDRCIERYIKKVEELLRHFSEDPRGAIEAIIEVTKYLSLKVWTKSAFDLFEKLLQTIQHRRSHKSKSIDVSRHTDWLSIHREKIRTCQCRECTFGREIVLVATGNNVSNNHQNHNNNNNHNRHNNNNHRRRIDYATCPFFSERTRTLERLRPSYNFPN